MGQAPWLAALREVVSEPPAVLSVEDCRHVMALVRALEYARRRHPFDSDLTRVIDAVLDPSAASKESPS